MNKSEQWPKPYLKANYRMIEQDLYTYRQMKKIILEKMDELEAAEEFSIGLKATVGNDLYMTSAHKKDGVHYQEAHGLVRNVSNTTEQQAVMDIGAQQRKRNLKLLLSGTYYAEMIKRVETIDYVLGRLERSYIGYERKQAELIRERYFEHQLTVDGLAMKYNISRRTVFYWIDKVIEEIASNLGILVR